MKSKSLLALLAVTILLLGWVVLRDYPSEFPGEDRLQEADRERALAIPDSSEETGDGIGPVEFIEDGVLAGSHTDENVEESDDEVEDAAEITHMASKSGDWSDPSVWKGGELPGSSSRVLIPEGVEIALDYSNESHLKSIQVNGSLRFSTSENTQLKAENVSIGETGLLEVGREGKPVEEGVEALLLLASLEFPEAAAEDAEVVPHLHSEGKFSMAGQPKSTMVPLANVPKMGDRVLTLERIPENWQEGDLLAIGGGRVDRDEEYTLEIEFVSGTRVGVRSAGESSAEWSGLKADHDVNSDLRSFVINLSRNAAIASEDPEGDSRNRGASIRFNGSETILSYVGGYGLGVGTGSEMVEVERTEHPVVIFGDNSGAGNNSLVGLALVDAPETWLETKNSVVHVKDSVAYDQEGGAWLTEFGSVNRLLWMKARKIPPLP